MSTRRKRPSQQRSRTTYDAILEAATRVFASEGMAATTNRIADEAGVSVGSLYQYFGDKYEILSELASRHVSAARERFAVCLADIAERELTPDEAVRLLVECAIEVNSNPRQFFHLLYDQVPRTPELIEQVEGMNRQLVLGFSEYLQSRGFSADDALLTSRLTVTAVDGQVHRVVLESDSPEELCVRTEAVVRQARSMIASES
ncbi:MULTISPECIES: TetR/AcrR family transcriptional regulator [unclassified Rhodococcus (in: high G+C Gram-positive bacteria)]|uniref:TetR/AcrR family transcriptional regulator n=1 Tax=unclassified Rhodococcus (in: high G+C Gram-positive bacteria) TaxID=192944 RepID=UPI0024B7C910|nr:MULTISPECIES: TetR/AcrR family transcriptional regulator [unclassified Rhodococcus (in: high G+C Gram-positive bacteria)]MDI9957222.1 TetR/AcrR family transcriptional regulator [Rhodococcus sp. IEGM 1237]MDI9962237.1 TetR/AcrR family transcriptional regulator [Rhodococcus sp. IEGM 1251]MDV8125425.1 TetR/AcrR family transcriptional regulator [Rhodococcus sp. IEGM 1304]